MRFIAEYVMKSPGRAMSVAGAAAFVPYLAFISAAVVALVWLRMGAQQGVKVLAVASIPGIYYLVSSSSPEVLLAVLGAAGLAALLRSKGDWVQVLMLASLVACGIAVSFKWLNPELEGLVIELLIESGSFLDTYELSSLDQERLQDFLGWMFNGVITSVQLLLLLGSLLLARWWQAILYNPGGFQAEFHSLLLPRWVSALLPITLIFMAAGQMWLLPVVPVLMVPYLLAAISLVHGVFRLKNYNSFWLGLLYVALITTQPYVSFVLVTFALADSWVNFRRLLAPPPPPPPQDGAGEA